MLTYVSSGSRDFGEHAIAPYSRGCWEFYAVFRGRVAPVFGGDLAPARPPLEANSLWVFSPDNIHGWRGEPHRHALVAVFHFDRIALALAAHVKPGGFLRVTLGTSARALTRLAHELQPLVWQGGEVAPLRIERAMLDLSILALDAELARAPRPAPTFGQRVEMAERWFASQLESRPTLVSIACRLGISTAQMRRLFVTERGIAPKTAFEAIRLARAKDLLLASDLKLEAVAVASGYASASVLVQAFRRAYGVTPDAWRRAHVTH